MAKHWKYLGIGGGMILAGVVYYTLNPTSSSLFPKCPFLYGPDGNVRGAVHSGLFMLCYMEMWQQHGGTMPYWSFLYRLS